MADGPTSLDDFTPEQLKALQDIAQARVDDSLSRRDALKALGMVGGGAATGAVGASTLADPAKADASTTDSDGDVGAPNDRVDGFFDGVDATSVNTGELNNDGSPVTISDVFDRSGVAAGSKTPLHKETAASGDFSHETVQITENVGTGGSKIYSLTSFSDTGNDIQWFWIIYGTDKGATQHWIDIVIATKGSVSSVVASAADGDAHSRSYSTAGTGLTLSVGSDTADVLVVAKAAGVSY